MRNLLLYFVLVFWFCVAWQQNLGFTQSFYLITHVLKLDIVLLCPIFFLTTVLLLFRK